VNRNAELVVDVLNCDDVHVRKNAADTLLVFLSIITEDAARPRSDHHRHDEPPTGSVGQHALYQLATAAELCARDPHERRESGGRRPNKLLRHTAARLLRLIHRLHDDGYDIHYDHNDDHDGHDDRNNEEDEEEEDLRLILYNSPVTPQIEVYQPELIVRSERYAVTPLSCALPFAQRVNRHKKQLRSLSALTGPSLAIYIQV
jgi:hypothetical protein